MKTNNKLLALSLLAMILFIFSCSKEEEASKNNLNYDGRNYPLVAAYVGYDPDTDQEPPVYIHEIVIVGRGIAVANHDFTGTGDVFAFGMGFTSQTIEPGTYHYNYVEGSSVKAGDLMSGIVGFNINTDDYTGEIHFVSAGKVVVTKSGDTYTFDVDVVADGKALKAHFTGPIATI